MWEWGRREDRTQTRSIIGPEQLQKGKLEALGEQENEMEELPAHTLGASSLSAPGLICNPHVHISVISSDPDRYPWEESVCDIIAMPIS